MLRLRYLCYLARIAAMATSQGGLRIMAGAGAKKDPATEAVAVVPGGDVKEAVAASAEVAPTAATDGDAPPPRLRTERVDNVMGSQAGAGSSDFHIYRRHRRTEQKRQEQLDADDEKQRRDREHAERVEAKRKECDARTAKNAAKRRKKKEAKAKRDAIAKGTGGTHSFEDDGSFLAKAKALVKEKE